MTTIVDISYWQGVIEAGTFAAWKAAGVSRVIVKAGGADGGALYKDSHHDANVAAARAAGLGVDHYFFNGTVDPAESAKAFVGFANAGTGEALWFDIENEGAMERWSPAQALEALQTVKSLTGVTAGVYMSSSVTTAEDWSAVAAFGAPLWVAQYGSNDGTEEAAPRIANWNSYTYWQYTSAGHEPGYNGSLDLSTAGNAPIVVVPVVTTESGYNASTVPTATIQADLIKLGYDLGPTGADGNYGEKTTAAVRAFEVKEKLTVDVGIAGPQVVAKLQALVGAGPHLVVDGIAGVNTTRAEQQALLKHGLSVGPTGADGARGEATVAAEQRLTGTTPVDGVDGPNTTRHLQTYLIHRGFTVGPTGVDGSRGPNTIKALQQALNAGKF